MKPITTKDENWRNRKVMLPSIRDLAVPKLTAGGISQSPFLSAAPRLPAGVKFSHQGVNLHVLFVFPAGARGTTRRRVCWFDRDRTKRHTSTVRRARMQCRPWDRLYHRIEQKPFLCVLSGAWPA